MNFRTGLAITAIIVGLGASSVAMDHGRDQNRDHGQFHRAAWHQDKDHDRKGWEKGKKTGWNDGALPPGQAKKDSKMWQREHKRDARAHHNEMKERQREARAYRHHSHPAIAHKQAKPPVNTEKKAGLAGVLEAKRANQQHRQEVQHK
jgi:hypothetical protein